MRSVNALDQVPVPIQTSPATSRQRLLKQPPYLNKCVKSENFDQSIRNWVSETRSWNTHHVCGSDGSDSSRIHRTWYQKLTRGSAGPLSQRTGSNVGILGFRLGTSINQWFLEAKKLLYNTETNIQQITYSMSSLMIFTFFLATTTTYLRLFRINHYYTCIIFT